MSKFIKTFEAKRTEIEHKKHRSLQQKNMELEAHDSKLCSEIDDLIDDLVFGKYIDLDEDNRFNATKLLDAVAYDLPISSHTRDMLDNDMLDSIEEKVEEYLEKISDQ